MLAQRSSGRRLASWIGIFATLALVVPGIAVLLAAPASAAPTPHVHTATSPVEASWVSVAPSAGPTPPGRTSGSLAYDPAEGYSVLFGGCNHRFCPLGDTWKYDTGNWSNLTATLSVTPPARQGSSLVFDVSDGYLLLYGGLAGTTTFGDAWKFSNGVWSLIPTQGAAPPPRSFAQAAYDPVRGAVVVFGGRSASGTPLADTWEYSAGSWTNLTDRFTVVPPARFSGVMAYDLVDGYSVLFGGAGAAGQVLGDTWALGANGWSNLSPASGPAPRVNSTLAFDVGRASVLLFGGFNTVALSDTWTFRLGTWSPLTENLSSSPGARYGSSSTFDVKMAYLLLYGGFIGGSRYTTWLLLSPLSATLASSTLTATPGTPITFTAGIVGGLAPYQPSWQFGDGSAPVVGLVASHTYSAPGTFAVRFTAADATGAQVSLNTTISVRVSPLNVTIHPSATSGKVGGALTFTTSVSGGTQPYAYAWSAPAGVCSGSKGPVLACDPASEGALQVSVTVTDASGQTASTGLTIPVAAAPGGGSATSPTPTPASPALGSAPAAWVVLVPLAVALAGALVVGTLMYVAGRRRARAQLAARPLCYAVPAWSETPPEFPPTPSGSSTDAGTAVEAWSRVESDSPKQP
ncbi:MAG TPA: kelch repeat-containing protein [Thermoplasmata archaeon]|nr:kelch repeat-containing protein [Thermoplasmata archaeon]